ncbi:hypothetical protein IFT80_18535 [Pseudomonas sp. CFBP 8771]|uniref:dermonecrotic toxin domain-containing protein n=1 Tax=Pseudomonas sp. CFBP 8771 TaxID=2775285 RepID=UPI0017841118|nr:DUF6543 domain-containing protein [Pseudomonas sp. CFBP 8771]MBD8604643.1 hypothetical protein [Pseudomonas sp. CFBP 8771]
MRDANHTFTIRPLAYRIYPMRHDHLLQEGSLLWERARARLQALLRSAPRARDARSMPNAAPAREQALQQRWLDYWNGRAAHTAISRRAAAEQAFLDHLQAAAGLAYYHGQLSNAQLLPLLTLLEGTNTAATASIHVHTLALHRAEGTRLQAPGALLLTQVGDEPAAQLLYLPCGDPALIAFADRPALHTYLLKHRSQIWTRATEQTDAAIELSYPPAQLASACEQWLDDCGRRYVEEARTFLAARERNSSASPGEAAMLSASEPPFARLASFDAPEPAQPSDDFAAFGSLSPDIPQSQRWAEVKRQHQAMLDLLGDELRAGADSPGWVRLKALLTTLTGTQQRAAQAAAGLLESARLEDLYRLRYLPNVHYSALYQARLDGLRAEVAVQQALGLLTTAQVQLMRTMVSHPQASKRGAEAGIACALTLSMSNVTGSGTTTHVHELHGVAAFMHPQALEGTGFVMLYWPGLGGGLQAFQSLAQLKRSLLRLDSSADAITLKLSPVAGDIFDYGLQGQLHACEAQASELIEKLPAATHSAQRLEALQRLTTHTCEQLLVPTHAARDRAYVQLTQEGFSDRLESGLPTWLKTLEADDRLRLKSLISDYIGAARASNRQLERDLPDLDQYADALLQQRLRSDFNLTEDVAVVIDIPDRVVHRRHPVAGSGAPGTPQHSVPTPDAKRTPWPLGRLAQHNIDADMLQRLGFMRVQVTGADNEQCVRVAAGIDLNYLRRTITDLNVAQACEDKIRQAFLGRTDQAPYALAHQRECLLEPVRLMLHMQSEYARHQGSISRSGIALALLATDAGSALAYQAGGRDVQLLPARLMAGGSDTDDSPTTLSGVIFIHDRKGGQTLLYLPDAPDQRCLREFASLEEARLRLFALTFDGKMADYLADRAIVGNTASHKARIEQAGLRGFDRLIGIGRPWPATTSLASHLLDAHMGRLVEAQRRRGRSNDALYLQQAALAHGNVFNYLKMAIGVLPFVGTAVALFDAWTAANAAVGALRGGQFGEALNQLEALLCALIDAAMDVLPGAVSVPGGGRMLARNRHWSMLARRAGAPGPTQHAPTGLPNPFAGYQYTLPLDLSGLQPASHGLYRGIYRHAKGDFILRDGLPYQVTLHASPQTWRLHGTTGKTYRQPIALDPTGRWQTHGALYGTLVENGLAGGGGVLGYLGHRAADGLQPLWPVAIRERLPRWLVDRQYRRHFELSSSIDHHNKLLREQLNRNEALIMEHAADPRQRASAEAACASDIARGEALYRLLQEHEGYVSRDFLKRNRQFQSEVAYIVAGRRINHANLARRWITELTDTLNQTRPAGELFDLPQRQMLEQRRSRLALDEQFGLMEQRLQQARSWAERVTQRSQRAPLREVLEGTAEVDLEIARASNLTQLAHKTANASDIAQMFHLLDTHAMRNRFHHGLESHFQLLETAAGLRDRQNVLRSSRQIYVEYRNQLNTWVRNRPDRFELASFEGMIQSLNRLIEHADRTMPQLSSGAQRAKPATRATRRVFETHEHDFFIGDAGQAADGEQIFTLTGAGGRLETYRRVAGQWRLQDAPSDGSAHTPSRPLPALIAEGQAWLDATPAHERRVQRYALPGEAPANLEDLMVNQGRQLELRAHAIEQQAPAHELAQRLRARARELRAKGRALRIRQAMNSQTPTEGYLDYLVEQRQVDIVQVGTRRDIASARDEADFLQEYVIRDIGVQPPVPLWYAHFHYRRERAAFEQFDKAHIKRAEQRTLGLRWQEAHGSDAQRIWRGPIGKPLAVKLFGGLQA